MTRVIGREVERANGVLVSADDKYLFVADNNNDTKGGARKLWRFDLKQDGTVDLESQKLLYDWGKGRGPDGLKQDAKGRLYVAGGLNKPNPPAEPAEDEKGGIYVLDPEGKLLTFLPVPTRRGDELRVRRRRPEDALHHRRRHAVQHPHDDAGPRRVAGERSEGASCRPAAGWPFPAKCW